MSHIVRHNGVLAPLSTPGFVTTPLDVIKTRLMVQGAAGRYKNLADATVQVWILGRSALFGGKEPLTLKYYFGLLCWRQWPRHTCTC